MTFEDVLKYAPTTTLLTFFGAMISATDRANEPPLLSEAAKRVGRGPIDTVTPEDRQAFIDGIIATQAVLDAKNGVCWTENQYGRMLVGLPAMTQTEVTCDGHAGRLFCCDGMSHWCNNCGKSMGDCPTSACIRAQQADHVLTDLSFTREAAASRLIHLFFGLTNLSQDDVDELEEAERGIFNRLRDLGFITFDLKVTGLYTLSNEFMVALTDFNDTQSG